jgi:hypothetical protein
MPQLVVFSFLILGAWGPLSDGKIRDIRLFFAITPVMEVPRPGDSLLKSGPDLGLF